MLRRLQICVYFALMSFDTCYKGNKRPYLPINNKGTVYIFELLFTN